MIAAGDPQVFVPYGRKYLAQHPGDVYQPYGTSYSDVSGPVRSFSSLNDFEKSPGEKWSVRLVNENGYEEELYVNDHHVVWSKNGGHGTQEIVKSFTAETTVQEALWCSFSESNCKPYLAHEDVCNKDVNEDEKHASCISIMDSSSITVFTGDGHEHKSALPFQLSKAWTIKYGLLFERVASSTSTASSGDSVNTVPVIFSLLHPLVEVVPVVRKVGSTFPIGQLNYCDTNNEIVFTESEPSILVMYHKNENLHSIWKVRRTTVEEANFTLNSVSMSSSSCRNLLPQAHTPTGSSLAHQHSSVNFRRYFHQTAQSPSASMPSPFYSRHSIKHTSPPISRIHSPSLTHMATISRSSSPLPTRKGISESSLSSPHFSLLYRTSTTANQDHYRSFEEYATELIEPLAPDICLDHAWSEIPSSSNNYKASKVFLTVDLMGQTFVCFLITELFQLRFLRFDLTNENKQFIFGTMNAIPAKDAQPIPENKMVLVLESSSSLTLYTGHTKVCKVHVPTLSSPFSNVSGIIGQHVACSSRRTSLITSSRPPSALGTKVDDFGGEIMLSPVPAVSDPLLNFGTSFLEDMLPSVLSIRGLKDGVRNIVTLETTNDVLVRITLPGISNSATVHKCLQALRLVLPRDVALQVFVKWYTTRNAPGPSDLDGWSDLHSFLLCVLGLMGYDVDHLFLGGLLEKDLSLSPVVVKKQRHNEQGSDEDWSYLLASAHHVDVQKEWGHVFCSCNEENRPVNSGNLLAFESGRSMNMDAPLSSYLPVILFALHLVYEDCKLNLLQHGSVNEMVFFLHVLARDLQMTLYLDYYWRDCPSAVTSISTSSLETKVPVPQQFHVPAYFTNSPPSIYSWVESVLRRQAVKPFPYIDSVTVAIRNVVMLFVALCHPSTSLECTLGQCLKNITPRARRDSSMGFSFLGVHSEQLLLSLILKLGLKRGDIDVLPPGIAVPLLNMILHCRKHPPSNLDSCLYKIMGRPDLALLSSEHSFTWTPELKLQTQMSCNNKQTPKEEDDGVDHLDHEVLGLLFPKDQRVLEVCRMLQSSKPVRILLQQRPEVSDHDFVDEQERHLYSLSIRTMGLPVGRGMLTLRTHKPVPTETFSIPKLCISGRCPPKNTTIELSHIEVPPNMTMWPLFHNGVAAGLRITPNASQIDSAWIVYNKPYTTGNDSSSEHAGFLMALGLNGHLSSLAVKSIYDYLCKGHEMTNVGLLLGLAATMCGTMDITVTKMMSVHLEALLPPTSTELDVPPVVQVTAVLGIGLLYQGSGHRRMAEVLLGEIGRPPGPEMEHCVDRESYAVAAGLALGLVTLGKGCELNSHSDMTMSDHLFHYMVGGHKRHLTGMQKEKYKSPSYQIREGECVNVDVTSPGATLALGMMFFDTGNRSVAEWVTAPDTQYLLEMVRPDFLLLRTLCRGLIMWSEVHPSKAWINSHVPQIVSQNAFKEGERDSDIDYETMSQAYCNIIAGACMCLGLKFAGSANEEAFETLMGFAKMFIALPGKPVAEQAGKSTIETCLNVVVLSLAMVMAGTGDLEVMRICHYLRSRVGQSASYVLYGSHMATHMALGLLFLGGGRYTLSTSPEAVGAMLCAFFPKFPTHSNDNRYHLQAFRHLYVLAAEPRLVIPRDIDTGRAVYTHLCIKLKDTQWYQNVSYVVKAPCLLPDLNLLSEIVVDDARYWPIVFNCDKNWKDLKFVLESNGVLAVKQKAGCLPYKDDPKGFRSLLAQNVMKNAIKGSMLKPGTASDFSCDPVVANFASAFLPPQANSAQERQWQQQMCAVLFECASQEKMEALPYYLNLYQLTTSTHRLASSLNLWQVRLVLAFSRWLEAIGDEISIPAETLFEVKVSHPNTDDRLLLRTEFVWFLKNEVEKQMRANCKDQDSNIVDYLQCSTPIHPEDARSLVPALVYYGIPPGGTLNLSQGFSSLPSLFLQLQNACPSIATVSAILRNRLFLNLDKSQSFTMR